MREIMKKGVCVILIYFVAIICTFILTNRIERLEAQKMIENGTVLFEK